MLLILLALAAVPFAVGRPLARAIDDRFQSVTAPRSDRDPYRNHKLTDPVAMAAAVRRHDRPYLGPRTRSKVRR